MKTFIAVLVTFHLFIANGYSQTTKQNNQAKNASSDTKVKRLWWDNNIVYDFFKDTLTPGNKEYWVKENSKVTFRITNVNRLLYDV
ncbi:MAG: hypothetical protein ACJ76F_11685, partial [Bacteroidia bacterium]